MIHIRKYILLCLLCAGLFAFPVRAEFVEGIEDIPVMEGLRQQHGNNVSFGNEETRFVEAYFSSAKLSFGQVADFYRDTLPQLGWKLIEQDKVSVTFERDMESLKIVRERISPLLLRLTLTSKD